MKPLLKWAGGKSQLLPQLIQRLPSYVYQQDFCLIEPFVGGGAVSFWALSHLPKLKTLVINDFNQDLTNVYHTIKHQPHELIAALNTLQLEYDTLTELSDKKPFYYAKRTLFNQRSEPSVKQASLFIFLNKAGFNGLYRVNKHNQFNVPIGSYKQPKFLDEAVLWQLHHALQAVTITTGDFEQTFGLADSRLPCLFYIDPPYRPLSQTANFNHYSHQVFDDTAQIRLANFCKKIDNQGYQFLLSNSDPKNSDPFDEFFDKLYQGFTIDRVLAKRCINAHGEKRQAIHELLIYNYPWVCPMSELYTPEHFNKVIDTIKQKGLTQYTYFVNWSKVIANIEPIEKELNLLNTAIGKDNIESVLFDIFHSYPKTIKAIPTLLAIRDSAIEILIDSTQFIYRNFNFADRAIDDEKIHGLVELLMQSGFGQLLKDKQIKSIPDYCIGVEVGLDSNGRKNRSGTSMEKLVESFVALFCHAHDLAYLAQANAKKIADTWGITIQTDKSSRIIDFVIKKGEKLYFIECNFYGGGGSKLKSTATDYIEMARFWHEQSIEFIWVTDGKGWLGTQRPLQDYFERGNLLLNIQMLQEDYLSKIILADWYYLLRDMSLILP